MHTVSKFLRLAVVGLDLRLAAALVPVVTFTRASGLPVEVDVDACQALCDCACFRVALTLTLLVELGNKFLLVNVDASVDGVGYSFMEQLQVRFLGPCILDGL